MTILVTGAAGFIGYHVAKQLLERGETVVGLDVLNDYYDVKLKQDRIKDLSEFAQKHQKAFFFDQSNLADHAAVDRCFAEHKIKKVIHLAAQAGVRYSLINPRSYIESNIVGFLNVLEACRHNGIAHLTYASSSSVYGANTTMPFSEHHSVNHPLQLYAASKISNEVMAHSYSHLYALPTTGLRFFTVYGPWGRPDMALFKFTKNIIEEKSIDVFNNGDHLRDFTYIDDITEGVIRASNQTAQPNADWDSNNPDPSSSNAPFRIYNIGNNNPVKLDVYIKTIEEKVGKIAIRNLLPMQKGDVHATSADCSALESAVGYRPSTSIDYGIEQFVHWYCRYYGINLAH